MNRQANHARFTPDSFACKTAKQGLSHPEFSFLFGIFSFKIGLFNIR